MGERVGPSPPKACPLERRCPKSHHLENSLLTFEQRLFCHNYPHIFETNHSEKADPKSGKKRTCKSNHEDSNRPSKMPRMPGETSDYKGPKERHAPRQAHSDSRPEGSLSGTLAIWKATHKLNPAGVAAPQTRTTEAKQTGRLISVDLLVGSSGNNARTKGPVSPVASHPQNASLKDKFGVGMGGPPSQVGKIIADSRLTKATAKERGGTQKATNTTPTKTLSWAEILDLPLAHLLPSQDGKQQRKPKQHSSSLSVTRAKRRYVGNLDCRRVSGDCHRPRTPSPQPPRAQRATSAL